MTDKLKCPFCGAELEQFQDCARCNTENCVAGFDPMSNQVWQALIDGKKAQDALARAISWLETISIVEMGCATSNTAAKRALDEITSITKQEE